VILRTFYKNNVFGGVVAWFGSRKAPEFLKRAEIAAKQIRYFRLFSQKVRLRA
jgi:hypothetical protein